MIALPAPAWKHTTAATIYEIDRETQEIHVFDDEQPGFLTLYAANGPARFPIRSIDCADPEHLRRVLSAWSQGSTLVDFRQNKADPLP